jgi:hypothetical protein
VILFSNRKSDFKKLSQIIHCCAAQNHQPMRIAKLISKNVAKALGCSKDE